MAPPGNQAVNGENKPQPDVSGETGLLDSIVVQKFGGGPYFACCPKPCEDEGKCRAPQYKVPSLAGMGICVDQLCKDLSFLTRDEG